MTDTPHSTSRCPVIGASGRMGSRVRAAVGAAATSAWSVRTTSTTTSGISGSSTSSCEFPSDGPRQRRPLRVAGCSWRHRDYRLGREPTGRRRGADRRRAAVEVGHRRGRAGGAELRARRHPHDGVRHPGGPVLRVRRGHRAAPSRQGGRPVGHRGAGPRACCAAARETRAGVGPVPDATQSDELGSRGGRVDGSRSTRCGSGAWSPIRRSCSATREAADHPARLLDRDSFMPGVLEGVRRVGDHPGLDRRARALPRRWQRPPLPGYLLDVLGAPRSTSRVNHGTALHVRRHTWPVSKSAPAYDAPISNRTEGAAEVAVRVAQQDAAPGKGKAAAGLASGIEKVQGSSLPRSPRPARPRRCSPVPSTSRTLPRRPSGRALARSRSRSSRPSTAGTTRQDHEHQRLPVARPRVAAHHRRDGSSGSGPAGSSGRTP